MKLRKAKKAKKRLEERIRQYDAVPVNHKRAVRKPGSLNPKKG